MASNKKVIVITVVAVLIAIILLVIIHHAQKVSYAKTIAARSGADTTDYKGYMSFDFKYLKAWAEAVKKQTDRFTLDGSHWYSTQLGTALTE